MNPQRMYAVLIAPHVSEKSTMMSEQSNHYAFKVAVDATKPGRRSSPFSMSWLKTCRCLI